MSVMDNAVRADVAVDPHTHVVGGAAAAAYIEDTFGMPFDADDLAAFADIGAGPPVERMFDGQPIYAKRALDGWVLKEYGAHDGSPSGIGTMLWMFFSVQGGPGVYVPTYCPATGKVDLVWRPDWVPTEEENARMNAERDRLDPIIEPKYQIGGEV